MTDPALLASDLDRDLVAERLRVAAGEGRLTPDELEQRLELAFGARTHHDLASTVVGLPAPRARRTPRGAGRGGELRAYIVVMALLVAIWIVTGLGYFWPIWPMLGWGFALLAGGSGGCRERAVAWGERGVEKPA